MKIRVVAALVTAALTAQANAAGFQLAEYSATGLGRAYAGEAAIADNASSQGRNPALLMELEGQQLSAGLIYVDPNIEIKGDVSMVTPMGSTPLGDGNEEDITPSAFIPNFYYSNRINDQWAFGISLNANHGMSTELPSAHNAAIFGSDVAIETVEFAPAVAYQLTDSIALGASLRVVYGDGHVVATAPSYADSFGLPGGATVKGVDGDGVDYGYQLGATWEPSAHQRIGFSYRSEVELALEGEAEGLAYGLLPGQKRDGELTLPLPATAELAALHQFNDRVAVHASINWTDWSAFETLTVDFPDSSDLLKEENFKDSWRYAIGTTYNVDSKMTLRGGVALDKGAVSDGNRTLSIPDSDRLWFSFGGGYQLSDSLTLDLSFTYIKADDASVNETVHLSETVGINYDGEISGDVWLAGAQLNYRF